MSRKQKTDFAPQLPPEDAPPCEAAGCAQPGAYKSPKSRDELHSYSWFCLDHIRERNAQWDYFNGMERDEIENFIKDAVTGHRPTWNRETRMRFTTQNLEEALYEFMHSGRKAPKPAPPLSSKLRKALSALDMSYPFTAEELKLQYRAMVKKYHPDVNQDNKKAEEMFKQVATAYRTLSEHIKSDASSV